MISQVNAGELRDGIGTSSTRQPRGQREVTVIFHDHLRLPVGVGGGGSGDRAYARVLIRVVEQRAGGPRSVAKGHRLWRRE